MTLVIRSDSSIATPRRDSGVVPPLGVSGVVGRWHALSIAGNAGDAVTGWGDQSDSGLTLTPSGTGTATLDEASGARAVSLVGSRLLASISGIILPNTFTLALRVYLAENPAALSWLAMTASTGTAAGIIAQHGGYRAYGDTSTNNFTGSVAKPAWSTLVATFNAPNQLGKIALNGGTPVAGTQGWTNPNPARQVRLSGGGTTSGAKFREVVILDHIATDAEMATLAADITP